MRRNSDEDIRRLERLAATGDEAAKARLSTERLRVGLPIDADALRALLQKWLKKHRQAHDVRFWSPEEWRAKGESFGADAGLIMTSEGGWNYLLDGIYPDRKGLVAVWDRLIDEAGWTSTSETNWCWSFRPKLRENARRNSDEDMRKLARKAGEGDPISAKRLLALIERGSPEIKVWVLTAVYDLDYTPARDTAAEGFVFETSDALYFRMAMIIDSYLRHFDEDDRDAIREAMRNEDYERVNEIYNDINDLGGIQPVTFYWSNQAIGP